MKIFNKTAQCVLVSAYVRASRVSRSRETALLTCHVNINIILSSLPCVRLRYCEFPYLFPNSFWIGQELCVFSTSRQVFRKPKLILGQCHSSHTDQEECTAAPLTSAPDQQVYCKLYADGRSRKNTATR